MKIGYKISKITFNQKLKLTLTTLVLHFVILYGLNSLLSIFKQPIGYLIIQSILFSIIIGFGFTSLLNRNSKKIVSFFSKRIISTDIEKNNILIEGPANLFRGIEAVGGKLFLTKEGLVFNSHKFNIQRGETKIPYISIKEFTTCYSSKLLKVNNGLKVHTKEGKTYKFVVNEREIWIKNIEEQLQQIKDS
tara:strand:- start:158 stop:730 length:573 start_codon:yes stop_codon:yes gene_type:complete